MRLSSTFVLPVALSTLLACGGGTVPAKDAVRDTDTGEDLDTADTGDSGVDTGADTSDTSDTSAPSEDCTDGADNDADGATDCDDSDCAGSDACPANACWDTDLGSVTGENVASGSTTGAGDDLQPSCDARDAATEDATYRWTAPSAGTWRMSTVGSASATILTAWSADCSGDELACATTGVLERRFAEGASVVIGIDASSDYVLHIVPADTLESGCTDGTDTDFDGLAGCDDPDCATVPGCAVEDCAGGVDEDGDGITDCDDSDCVGDAACLPEGDCANGADDDRDGLADCDDTDCVGTAVCIPETACDDGLDDDYDGATDCDDSDCAVLPECAGACADGDLGSATGASVATGTTTGAGDDSTPSCGSSRAEDVLYTWTAPASDTYTFSMVGSSYDSVMTVNDGDCSGFSELDCNDDTSGTTSEVTATLVAGDRVYIDVDGYSTNSGAYVLSIYGSAESACADGADDDGDGLVDCDDSDCDLACPEGDCADGTDEDGDGLADCDDSDCVADAACLEETDCTDGLDDDGDGFTDCDDPSCADDTYCIERACYDGDLGSVTGAAAATVTLSGDDVTGSCGYGGDDTLVTWTAPGAATWTFTATPDDPYDYLTLEVASGDCSGLASLGCDSLYPAYDGDPSVSVTLAAGDEVSLVLESYYGYATSVSLAILADREAACTDGVDDDGDSDVDCDDSDCASSCYELDCSDGVDGDGDGTTDCDDSDCAADPACLPEADCEDGLDDDSDGLTDCDDSDCASAFACTATCFDGSLGSSVGYAVATGSTAGTGDDRAPSCSTGSSEDVAYLWTAPATDTYTFSLQDSDYDTALTVEEASCTSTELACNDDFVDVLSIVTVALTAGEQVLVNVDGYDGETGNYVLSITGSTESDCSDGIDEDGDGYTDCDDTDCATDTNTWYYDADGDRFGDDTSAVVACDAPSGYVHDGGDCDDSRTSVRPYAWEDTSNGIDDDCDGATDTVTRATLALADDSSTSSAFASGFTFPFCGSSYSSVNVGSNGRLTFDASSTSYSEDAGTFVAPSSTPRRTIAALWDDLNPGSASSTGVYTVQHDGAFTVYFRSVVEYSATVGNTFAYTLLADGRFRIDYGGVAITDGLVGWSCGTGTTATVSESDLTALASAIPTGGYGIRTGSPHAIYELFTGSSDPNDMNNASLLFCPTNGTDADADGWTTGCGDRDDSDSSVYPM